MPQPPSEPYSSPDNPKKIYVPLPDKPPAVTETVAAALLQLLHAVIADPGQQRPDHEDA
ncbi:hypothetical protein [Streptomyces sp. RB17]|uniref:hypothetical protein n=1 Tax=Streptomyces sp. RB17 TaxID=2585197 RepID=UPI0012949BC6|nr:hypothetical protein [Streptomyces sp. RB17]